MQVSRIAFIALLVLGIKSCIEPFEPELRESQEVMVISGVITDRPGIHRVEISMSAPYSDPSFQPVSGCAVTVKDGEGNSMEYQESEPGIYAADLPESFLSVGKAYAVTVEAPDGKQYRSHYDTLLACPAVDSIYYELSTQETTDPDQPLEGIQFYSDLLLNSEMATNFRWILEETWEYTSPYTGNYVWFGGEQIDTVFEDTVSRCYYSAPIRSIFTATTQTLTGNRLRRNPLNFVSTETPRLKIKYSLLVEQQSLTDGAFEYWDRLRSMTQETGGLYETQPPNTAGNLYHTGDAEERVLGYFYATQPQQRRIMVDQTFDYRIPAYGCELDTFNSPMEVYEIYPELPIYLIALDPELKPVPPFASSHLICFDCRRRGGTNKKPDYWDP
jgi:hypothetical protein